MFPPERIATAGPFPSTRPESSAATDAAPAPSTTQLCALEEQEDRLADLLVGDGDDVVEQIGEQRRRELARLLDRDPLGDRVAELGAAGHGRARGCLDADDSHIPAGPPGARARSPRPGRPRRSG